MRRARAVPFVIALLLGGTAPVALAQGGAARPVIEIRLAGTESWGGRSAAEQQPGLEVSFFLQVTNAGDAAGSFAVHGDHGGATFGVRYLEGGAGDHRITDAVERGRYVLEDVPPGATRTVRLRVKVDGAAALDRSGDWTVDVSSVDEADRNDEASAEVRTVARAFARAGGVTLRMPAADASITFHESLFDAAAALRPIGTLVQNANPAFDPPPDTIGPGYIVMESRDRGTPPTSGSDDVVAAGEPILAPVSGTVIRVTSYELYCEWDDVRVAIRPADAPQRTVQIFHLVGPQVERGDEVLVSHTVLGTARLFPFRSQTQDYGLGARHVHLEIELDGSTPLPGCGGQALRPMATALP